jgi:hypothetical protein
MTELMKASRQWATRPSDERFVNLYDLLAVSTLAYERGRQKTISTRALEIQPASDDPINGLQIVGSNGRPALASHWSFGQLATLAGAPAGYLRDLPAPIVADAMNYGLKFNRKAEDIKVLLSLAESDEAPHDLRAATGPNYGRIWNRDIVQALINRVGDGATGDFKVPGEFGKDVLITKDNTTIYGSDRDMFVFLADEKNRVEVANRRNGRSGSLARGFFLWNSEVGSQSIGFSTFLFDYACSNRIVWGAQEYREIRIRHTAAAPDRWMDEVMPTLVAYSESSARSTEDTIKAAQARKVDAIEDFLAKRFTKTVARGAMKAHEIEENRPMETMWDAVTGVTAYAKSIKYQDERVNVERGAGKLLDLVKV